MLREQSFSVRTTAREQILLITNDVQRALSALTLSDGIATIIVPHTTCAISVNENADPDVPADLTKALRALVPKVRFAHGEGNSDAHFLSLLIGTSPLLALSQRPTDPRHVAGHLFHRARRSSARQKGDGVCQWLSRL